MWSKSPDLPTSLYLGEPVQFAAQQFQSPVGGTRIWQMRFQLHYVGLRLAHLQTQRDFADTDLRGWPHIPAVLSGCVDFRHTQTIAVM
jgi:hypothetical protein